MLPARLPQTVGATVAALLLCASSASAQVLFQQFYYPIDQPPKGTTWWQQATNELPALARLGVSAIWHPVPVKGGSGGVSMGYDPYDLYDLGSRDQKGTIATHFGTRDDYLAYVAAAHRLGIRVVADVVLNHAGGADKAEPGPIRERLGWDDIADDSKIPAEYRATTDPAVNLRGWTGFRPRGVSGQPGTGRFPRDYRHFHPTALHPDHNEPYHHPDFGQDYCFEAEDKYVWNNLCDWGVWFRAQTGVDGFRLDAVKLIEPPFLADFAARVTKEPGPSNAPFYLVGEFWDTNPELLHDFQRQTRQQMRLFDFGLFYALWDMTDNPQKFDMRDMWKRRFFDRERAVMFVSNHDVDRFQPIKRDRRVLPYAVAMTMAGQPSVFYLDYFRAEDKRLPAALEALAAVHNRYAVGNEILRYSDADVLAYERSGNLLAVFNDGGDNRARTISLLTGFGANVKLAAVGQLPGSAPVTATTDQNGSVTVTVAPGDYLLLARADATTTTNPDRFPRLPMRTTQTHEFADDLDTGNIGPTPRSISVQLKAGQPLIARLTTATATPLLIEIRDASGKTIGKAAGKVSNTVNLRTRIPRDARYQITVTAPETATTGHLQITY